MSKTGSADWAIWSNMEGPTDDTIDSRPTDRTILITGGGGFLGSHLATALVADDAVRVLDDFSDGSRERVPEAATIIEGDVRDPTTLAEAMVGVEVVFHLAAMVSVARSVERPYACQELNTGATVRVLEAARRQDARVVFASSAAVYGQPTRIPIAEGDPKTPTSPYGISKLAADQYVRSYADLYGLETVSLRYFNAYGPGQPANEYSGVISVFLDQARRGEPLTVHGDGSQTRDFVHVSDIVRANLAAATSDHVGRAFNISTGDSVSIRRLAEIVVGVTDSESAIVHDDPRPGDVEHSQADLTNARTKLGYEPTVALEEGLSALANGESPSPR